MHNLSPVGVWGSTLSNMLVLMGLQLATTPSMIHCLCVGSAGDMAFVQPLATGWRPYIDFASPLGAYGGSDYDASLRCPTDERYGVPPKLAFAPMPVNFVALEDRAAPTRYACILVNTSGTVSAAYLLRPSPDADANRALLKMIVSSWRFEADAKPSRVEQTWQRVRVNNTDGGTVYA